MKVSDLKILSQHTGITLDVLKLSPKRYENIERLAGLVKLSPGTRKMKAQEIGISQNRLRLIEGVRYAGPDLLRVYEYIGAPVPAWVIKKYAKL